MKKIFWMGVVLSCLVTSASAECPVGYRPRLPAYYVTGEDILHMGFSDNDRITVEAKVSLFQGKAEDLRVEFREKSAALTAMLTGRLLNRQEVDEVSGRLVEIIRELSEMRVEHALEMSETLPLKNARRIRIPPDARDSRCEGAVSFPAYRYELSAKERQLIGVTDDEKKYLKHFEAREAYFRTEQRDLRQRLDFLLSARRVDQDKVDAVLDRLAVSVRERTTNRLDRYFYADKVLFSADREKKLLSSREKLHRPVKKAKPAKKVRKVKKEKRQVVKETTDTPKPKKKWYWPF